MNQTREGVNPLHVGMKLQKEQKQGRDETTNMVEKRHKITLHLFHALGRRDSKVDRAVRELVVHVNA